MKQFGDARAPQDSRRRSVSPGVASMTLTPAQEKARRWLPPDGAWRSLKGTHMHAALNSLSLAWPACVGRRRVGAYDSDGYLWAFTPQGVERNKLFNQPKTTSQQQGTSEDGT